MIRNLTCCFILAASGFSQSPKSSPRPDRLVEDSDRGRHIAALIARLPAWGFQGAALVARDGHVLFAGGFGTSKPGKKRGLPNSANTLFETASLTKQFTGAALCRLAQSGKLDLDDKIGKFLPAVPENCQAITVRHLLSHTSGIPGRNVEGGRLPLEKAVPTFLKGGPKHAVGTHHEYWNQGYALAAAIIEKVSGEDFASYCKTTLFAPSQMRTACFTGDPAPEGASVATGSSSYGPPRTALAHPYGSYGLQYKGMGGAVANVWDLFFWHRALGTERILDKSHKTELLTPVAGNYALGWRIGKRAGTRLHEHSGSVRGFVSHGIRIPEHDACIWVLCNSDSAPATRIARLLEAAAFGRKHAMPPRPLPEASGKILTGVYVDDKSTRFEFETKGGITRMYPYWGGRRPRRSTSLVGLDANDQWILYEWSSSLPLRVLSTHEGRATRIRLGKWEMKRKKG